MVGHVYENLGSLMRPHHPNDGGYDGGCGHIKTKKKKKKCQNYLQKLIKLAQNSKKKHNHFI